MTSLPRYDRILSGDEKCKYIESKSITLGFSASDNLTALWEKHDNYRNYDGNEKRTLLDIKVAIASRIYQDCHFCEHKCHINRNGYQGKCNTNQSRIASEFLHYGEELILVPSYTMFFSGCTFKCLYCQNWDISQKTCGVFIDPKKLADIIERSSGINVNWVGGDPTPNTHYILEVLNHSTRNIPQIWNSNMYCSIETMKLLRQVMDIYLTDFKFGNDSCAKTLAKVENYWNVVTRNHLLASQNGEVIIRHLVLPNHTHCCSEPILEWISKFVPSALVNIMSQYRPCYQAHRYDDISRFLNKKEYQDVVRYGEQLGLNLI